jgi:hypothetical protein
MLTVANRSKNIYRISVAVPSSNTVRGIDVSIVSSQPAIPFLSRPRYCNVWEFDLGLCAAIFVPVRV